MQLVRAYLTDDRVEDIRRLQVIAANAQTFTRTRSAAEAAARDVAASAFATAAAAAAACATPAKPSIPGTGIGFRPPRPRTISATRGAGLGAAPCPPVARAIAASLSGGSGGLPSAAPISAPAAAAVAVATGMSAAAECGGAPLCEVLPRAPCDAGPEAVVLGELPPLWCGDSGGAEAAAAAAAAAVGEDLPDEVRGRALRLLVG